MKLEQKKMSIFQKGIIGLLFIVCVLLVIVLLPVNEQDPNKFIFKRNKAVLGRPYNSTYPLTLPTKLSDEWKFKIAIIADPDTTSKVEGKELWRSYLKTGYLSVSIDMKKVNVVWDSHLIPLDTRLSDGGRGAELSELVVFDGKLLSVDDRSGVVYELFPTESGYSLIPWLVLADGNGHVSKGFKGEWMTVKDKQLYVGGLGKVWTTTTGDVLNENPQYVKVVMPSGHIFHENWAKRYNAMMNSVGIQHPGYVIHEAGCWSPYHKKWFFLPRRASKETYNDKEDEHRATNIMFVCDEDFLRIQVNKVGTINPFHGFSSFKFIPGTQDRLIVGLKSEENNGKIATYIMVFTHRGQIVMPEQKIADGMKFEGIEFI
jgi:soluble calcium-activated nucleotidase 1